MRRNHIVPSSRPDIHLLELHPLGLLPELVPQKQDDKHRQQDITYHKRSRAERVQEGRVSLEEDEEDVGRQGGVGTVGIPHRFEGEIVDGLALSFETIAEADVDEFNGAPVSSVDIH